MFFWGPFPFVRISIVFALGILWDQGCSYSYPPLHWFFLVSLFTLVPLLLNRLPAGTLRSKILGCLSLLLIFLLGALHSNLQKHQIISHRAFEDGIEIKVSGQIQTLIDENEQRSRYVLEKVHLSDDFDTLDISSGILYLERKKEIHPLLPGDRFTGFAWVFSIPPPLNPGEFDLKEYYDRKGIRFRIFPIEGSYQFIRNDAWTINRISKISRNWIMSRFDPVIEERENLKLLYAITMGQRRALDEQMTEDFRKAGASHLLAVSGLHLGIVYLVVSWILSKFRKNPGSKYLASSFIIVLLFVFAFVTGAAASALRAALMFSIMEIGSTFRKKSSGWNHLGFAALTLLIINPLSLFDIGFQLSFGAMAGIFSLIPLIPYLGLPRNRIIRFPVGAILVTIAVMLSTLPVMGFHFGEIQPLGLLTNLFAGVAATLILSLFMAGIATSIIVPPLQEYVGSALEIILSSLHFLVHHISQIPLNTIHTPPLPFWKVLFLGALVLLFFSLCYERDPRKIMVFLLGLIIWFSIDIREVLIGKDQKELIVFSNRKGLIIAGIQGERAGLVIEQSINNPSWNYASYFHEKRIRELLVDTIPSEGSGSEIQILGKTILVHLGQAPRIHDGIAFLIINGPISSELSRLKKFEGQIMIGPRFWKKSEILDELNRHEIKFHDLSSGYYSTTIR